jgi:hypothetical protein
MPNATAARSAFSQDASGRRLAMGVLVSVLLHGLVLSLQFGIPGLRPGPGGPVAVRLAPAPAAVPVPAAPASAPVSVPPVAALPVPPEQAAPLPLPQDQPRTARHGFTLVDPVAPAPVPVPAAPVPTRAPPPRRVVKRRRQVPATRVADGLHTRVIAQETHQDGTFEVPLPAVEPGPMPDPSARAEATAEADEPAEPDATSEEDARAEHARLTDERERALRRDADEARLRAQAEDTMRAQAVRERQRLAEQSAEYEATLVERQRQADEERARVLADQRAAEDAQVRARQEEEERRLAEQQRLQQAQRERAQQLAEQRRAEEAVRQQLAEQEHTRQLAEERARQERAQQAEQAARRQAEENARLAREQALRERERDASGTLAAAPGPERARADGAGDGAGRGNGTLPRAALGSDVASRAREMMRGIDILKSVPQAVRPAEDAARAVRRALADAARHDIPLRMYIDSVRQKIERNAVLSEAQLAADVVRTDPIVSMAIRSDGSVEDVIILRSSGRADIDEFVRRIVRLNARYSAFPPNVAANYDVIELRRVWRFAGVLRLQEEMR